MTTAATEGDAVVGPSDQCPQCGSSGRCVLVIGTRRIELTRPHVARALAGPAARGPWEAVAPDWTAWRVEGELVTRTQVVGPSDDPTSADLALVGPSDGPVVESLDDGSPDGLISDLLALRPTEHAP